VFKIVLIALFTGLMVLDNSGTQMFRRPLPISLIIGIILGNVQEAILIGATLELTWLGLANVGGSSPADMIMGSSVGISIGVMSGGGVATGIAIAIPVSILAVQLSALILTFSVFIIHWADKLAEEGDFSKVEKIYFIPPALMAALYVVLSFLAIFLGNTAVEKIIGMIPTGVINGMSTAAGALPAVGLSILLTMMLKQKALIIFLVLGFVLVAYVKLPMLAVALFGVVFAGLWDAISAKAFVQPAETDAGKEVDL
jgi:PTS system mannose-specific IIC component